MPTDAFNKAPRSKLRGILRNSPKPLPSFAKATGYSAKENKFAQHCAAIVGSPWAFVLAVIIVMSWVVPGPQFAYSDTWQLAINQYRDDHCDIPYGISHPEFSES